MTRSPAIWIPLTLFSFAGVSCGGVPVATKPVPPVAKPPATRVLVDEGDFDVLRNRKVFGTEHVRFEAEGESFVVTLVGAHEMAGNKLASKGEIRYGKDLRPESSAIDIDIGGKVTTAALAKEGGALVARATQAGSDADHLKETKTSTLYLPAPFVAGFVPVCRNALSAVDAFVEFPGGDVKVTARKALAAGSARVIVFDRGGTRRTEVICESERFIGVREVWSGFEAVRKGEEKTLEAVRDLFERKKPSIPETLAEESVSVVVPKKDAEDEAKLGCSLVLPKAPNKAGFPAVAFVTGSGPQDRDEDTLGEALRFALFKHLAIRLGEAGIASLRCDDRGVGESSGDFKKATLTTFARDASATLSFLRADKRIDKKRTGLIGHSEGGIVGPLVASKDPLLHTLAILAAPARPLDAIGLKQAEDALKAAGLDKDAVEKKMEEQRAVIDAIKKGGALPEKLSATEKSVIEIQRPWLKSHFDNTPEKTLRAVGNLPIFVAQGELDRQVPKEEAEGIAKILKDSKKTKVEVKVYPSLNHLFMPTKTGSMADYSDPDARIDDVFLRDVVEFEKKNL